MAIDTSKMLKNIRENGKCECPLCGKGFFIAKKDIPVEKQTHFECSYCKEKYILNIRLNQPVK